MKHKKNHVLLIVIPLVFLVLIVLAFLLLTTPPHNGSLETQLGESQADLALARKELAEAKQQLTVFQSNEKYMIEEVRKARLDLNELRAVYSDLFTDASACYYANYCLYYEAGCLDTLGDLFVGYSAEEIHVVESDYCDGMVRDWEKYQSYDVELKE